MIVLKEPLTGAFKISSALMLHYGFTKILYESVNNDDQIDGWFYFKEDEADRLDAFVNLLKSAQLSSLVHDFDDICLSLDRIILRKWNSPYKITKQEVKEEAVHEDTV